MIAYKTMLLQFQRDRFEDKALEQECLIDSPDDSVVETYLAHAQARLKSKRISAYRLLVLSFSEEGKISVVRHVTDSIPLEKRIIINKAATALKEERRRPKPTTAVTGGF